MQRRHKGVVCGLHTGRHNFRHMLTAIKLLSFVPNMILIRLSCMLASEYFFKNLLFTS